LKALLCRAFKTLFVLLQALAVQPITIAGVAIIMRLYFYHFLTNQYLLTKQLPKFWLLP